MYFYPGVYMQVLFCSTENGRSSFVRQLEPDWHIDTNPEIVTQLAVCIDIYFMLQYTHTQNHYLHHLMVDNESCCRGLLSINFMSLLSEPSGLLLMYSVLHPWNCSLDLYDTQTT